MLPFNITPPKQTGPSEAERKVEALTKQIEEQMEKEEELEYFGMAALLLFRRGRGANANRGRPPALFYMLMRHYYAARKGITFSDSGTPSSLAFRVTEGRLAFA